MSRPILYSFRRCPYAMRARLALASADLSCTIREVALRDKPDALRAASPKATVPVLVLADGQVIDESLDIMLMALRRHDPDHWLKPQVGTIEKMLALIHRCDGPFKHDLDRYKYADRYDGAKSEDHRTSGLTFLNDLDQRLSAHQYLFGDRISLADMAIFPFVRQFAEADRPWFDAQPLCALQRWLTAHVTSARFARIMTKYQPWRVGDPDTSFP